MNSINLFSCNSSGFHLDNDSSKLVQSNLNCYQIISKTIENHNSFGTQTQNLNNFLSISRTVSGNPVTLYLKYIFYNTGIISDWEAKTIVEIQNDPDLLNRCLNNQFGFISFCHAASSFTYDNRYGNHVCPSIPIFLFYCNLIQSSSNYFISIGIDCYFIDIFDKSITYGDTTGDSGSITEINFYNVSFPTYLASPFDYNTPINNADNKILVRGTTSNSQQSPIRLELVAKKISFVNNLGKYETRYIFSVKNLNTSISSNHLAVVGKLPQLSYIPSYSEFRKPYGSNSFVSNYVDSVGVFEFFQFNQRFVSLNPKYKNFSVDVYNLNKNSVCILSDRVGLSYGIDNELELGRGYVSELMRTSSYPIINLSKFNLNYIDVLYCLDNIKLLMPSAVVLQLGMDTIGRYYYRRSDYIRKQNNLYYIDFSNFYLTIFRNVTRYKALSNLNDNNDFNSYFSIFKLLIRKLKQIGVSDIIVVGLPPISTDNDLFYTEYFPDDSITNFFATNIKNELLDFSNALTSESSNYNYYIDLRAELGNATVYNPIYLPKLGNSVDLKSIYFNKQGHDLLKNLLLDVFKGIDVNTIFMQSHRQIDLRIGLTKYLNAKKIYTIDNSQNYSIVYDAKIDINLPNTFELEGANNTDGWTKINIGSYKIFDYIIIIPFLGKLDLKLKLINSLNQSEDTQISLLPGRPTVMFTKFSEIYLRNEGQKEIPVSIMVGKMK